MVSQTVPSENYSKLLFPLKNIREMQIFLVVSIMFSFFYFNAPKRTIFFILSPFIFTYIFLFLSFMYICATFYTCHGKFLSHTEYCKFWELYHFFSLSKLTTTIQFFHFMYLARNICFPLADT